MDKEKLLAYFQGHYLSRQEVLFKLPLSMPIDTFWPELLSRRRAGAVALPLNNASGLPYWYVLTEKMIAASERICEEAMNQDERFDPYRAPMTGGMTREMFFTSFVEGARIPLQEAMDFLGRGTEPENVQEQMIWNNRQAWSAMVKALYKPLDEPFVKSLAFMLTDEMEGRADDYRQADGHPIAAMEGEAYTVPSASSLPTRMREYYDMLRMPDMHPLIKAAAGQAYLLAARPFPEGNERLSRMISSAVLLRSGYDFFRDISISSLIARENYRYYKAMREILRPENGSDLTYFMEYYLELLARALDFRKDRDRKNEEDRAREALERERQLAARPLGGEQPAQTSGTASLAEESKTIDSVEARPAMPDAKESLPHDSPYDAQRLKNCLAIFERAGKRPTERTIRVTRVLKAFFEQGVVSFSRPQWQEAAGIDVYLASRDCFFMLKNGLTASDNRNRDTVYTLTCAKSGAPAQMPGVGSRGILTAPDTPKADPYATIRVSLRRFTQTGTAREKRIAETLIELLDDGKPVFLFADWAKRTKLCDSANHDDLHLAQNYDLLELTDGNYRICTRIDADRRYNMLSESVSGILHVLFDSFQDRPFTREEAALRLGNNAGSAAYYLKQLRQRGILQSERRYGNGVNKYHFTEDFLLRQKSQGNVNASLGESVTGYNTGMVAGGVSAAAVRR